jgi:hypothetical protein
LLRRPGRNGGSGARCGRGSPHRSGCLRLPRAGAWQCGGNWWATGMAAFSPGIAPKGRIVIRYANARVAGPPCSEISQRGLSAGDQAKRSARPCWNTRTWCLPGGIGYRMAPGNGPRFHRMCGRCLPPLSWSESGAGRTLVRRLRRRVGHCCSGKPRCGRACRELAVNRLITPQRAVCAARGGGAKSALARRVSGAVALSPRC